MILTHSVLGGANNRDDPWVYRYIPRCDRLQCDTEYNVCFQPRYLRPEHAEGWNVRVHIVNVHGKHRQADPFPL